MGSELVQTGFFDLDPVASSGTDKITVIADWNGLSKEERKQEASRYHDELDRRERQLEAIKSFVEEQQKNVTYERGMLYAYMKATMPYEEWIEWLKSKNVSRSTANENIQWSTEYQAELTATTGGSRLLSRNQIRAIHRTGEGHEILAKVNSGEIDPTWEALNKEIEAANQRAEQAKRELEEERKAHSLFKDEHFIQIQTLEQKLGEKPEPVKVIEYQDTLETAAKVATLEQQIKALEAKPSIPPETQRELQKLKTDLKSAQYELGFYTEQNKALADEVKKYQEESGRSFQEITALAGQLRIKQEWQYATTELQASHRKFHARVPSLIDRESFESEEHTRTAQTIEVLEHTITLLKKLLPGNALDEAEIIEAEKTQEPLTISTFADNWESLATRTAPETYWELFEEYRQFVKSLANDTLWWKAPDSGIKGMEMTKDNHIHYTSMLIKNGEEFNEPYRIGCAIECMKRTLAYLN